MKRLREKDLKFFDLWMADACDDASQAKFDTTKLTKAEKADLRALGVARKLVEFYRDVMMVVQTQ